MSTIHLVPTPAPDILKDDLAQRMESRTYRENNLRSAFAAVVERDGWTSALEALGAELDEYAGEATHWYGEMWAMRSKAIFDLSNEPDLR